MHRSERVPYNCLSCGSSSRAGDKPPTTSHDRRLERWKSLLRSDIGPKQADRLSLHGEGLKARIIAPASRQRFAISCNGRHDCRAPKWIFRLVKIKYQHGASDLDRRPVGIGGLQGCAVRRTVSACDDASGCPSLVECEICAKCVIDVFTHQWHHPLA